MTGVSLVTGATGFLGAALVVELLRRGEVVRCVVRGASDAERSARLHAALASAAGPADPVRWDRVEVAPGELALAGLGLDADDLLALGEGVHRVVHCGARVNLALPYVALHEVNVRATEDLLGLAEACGAAFDFVGSLAAVAPTVTGEPFELTVPVRGGYGLSKWTADRLVAVAHQEGRVRATIMRPGRITAGLTPPNCNPDDLLERLLGVCVRLGRAPRLVSRVRFSPVDWVARLHLALSDTPASRGRAYHLVHDGTVAWGDVVAALGRAGHSLDELSYKDWRAAVFDAARHDAEVARLAGALPPDGLSFDARDAVPRRARRSLGEAYPEPPPATALLDATIAAWCAGGPLRTPTYPLPDPR